MEAALAASLGHDPEAASPPPEPSSPPPQPPPQPRQPPVPASTPQTTSTTNESQIGATPFVSPATNKSPTLFSTIQPSDLPEPPQSPQTTRIQFRFPEGGRPLVRRFNKSDTIRDVFAFVKGLRSDDQEEFELVFIGRKLLSQAEESEDGERALDTSIVEAGLANGSLTVEV